MHDNPVLSDGNDTGPGSLSGLGPGAIVMTLDGELPVEWLAPGDMLITRDHGAQPLRAVVRTRGTTPEGAPLPDPVLLFPGDCMTSVKPWEKLRLAPGHRVLIRTLAVQVHFGLDEALARPGDLTRRRRTRPDPEIAEMTYHHLIMARHELIMAGGLWVESTCPAMAERLGHALPDMAGRPLITGHRQLARPVLSKEEAILLRQSLPVDLSLTDLFAA